MLTFPLVQVLEGIQRHITLKASDTEHNISRAAYHDTSWTPDCNDIRAILNDSLDIGIKQAIANCRTYYCYGIGNKATGLRERLEHWDTSLLRAHIHPPRVTNTVFPYIKDRSIRDLVIEYHNKRTQKPISIAVFGPPGSGKSFGVKQIAESIPGLNAESVTCNLSQFITPNELAAFIRSRDISLQGKRPLIFFDEFDSEFQGFTLGWLKYFLSPMQDGEFKHGEAMLNIGKAIFIFAGGTNRTYQDFCHDNDEDGQEQAAFRHAKGLDFISRLRGFINVIGPDKRSNDDELFIMRRALVLRSVLEKTYTHLVTDNRDPIDTDVLFAMLTVGRYKHGVRSMEAILEMSTLGDARRFEKSHLPSEAQLDMHVDSYEFLKLMTERRGSPRA